MKAWSNKPKYRKRIAMVMTGRYSIIEVEQILGIPRTKIRYYMDRGLINARRDDHNGYYLYTDDDLMRISQIVYYRERLGFPLEEVGQLIEATDIEAIESITDRQLDYLYKEMRLRDQQRNTLIFNREMIERHQKHRDQISLTHFEPVYLVPFPYYFMLDHKIYPITYGASEFSYDGIEAKFVKRWVLVFEKDAKYVGFDVFDSFRPEGERVEADECVYSACLTTKSADDPSILQPSIDWASRHRFFISGRIFLTYFFPFYVEDTKYLHIETYLPVAFKH